MGGELTLFSLWHFTRPRCLFCQDQSYYCCLVAVRCWSVVLEDDTTPWGGGGAASLCHNVNPRRDTNRAVNFNYKSERPKEENQDRVLECVLLSILLFAGSLTDCPACRKRRIKCGEEKPRCNNCIKSKRECEGYGQRVVFRPPVGPIPHLDPITTAQNLPDAGHTFLHRQFVQSFPHGDPGARPFLPLAPRPSPYGHIADAFVRHEFAHPSAGSQPIPVDGTYPSWDTIQYTQTTHAGLANLAQGEQDLAFPHHQSGAGYDIPVALQPDSFHYSPPQSAQHPQFSPSLYVRLLPEL